MANYVDIEVAEPLKGVGFDEPVSKFWFKFGNSWIESDSGNIANYNSCAPLERFISKPSYDEVIHLFREKKGVCVFIEPGRFDMKGKWVPLIVDLPTTDLIFYGLDSTVFDSYTEAQLVGIREAINHLKKIEAKI